jgi:hypothetical protein
MMPFGLCNAPAKFELLMQIILVKRPLLQVMSHVPMQRDGSWPYIPRPHAQPVKSVSASLRSLPKAQSGEMTTLSNRNTVPWECCVTKGDNH